MTGNNLERLAIGGSLHRDTAPRGGIPVGIILLAVACVWGVVGWLLVGAPW
jgi:hypothetical protein